MATPPSFVAEHESVWNTTAPTLSAFTPATGNVLLAMLAQENGDGTTGQIAITGGVTWSNVIDAPGGSNADCPIRAMSGVGAGGSITPTFTWLNGSIDHGCNVLEFSGSLGIGASAATALGNNGVGTHITLNITTQADNSAIAVIFADFQAGAVPTSFDSVNGASPTAQTNLQVASHYSVAVVWYADAGAAGVKTVGATWAVAPDVMILAVEIKGGAGAANHADVVPDTYLPDASLLSPEADETGDSTLGYLYQPVLLQEPDAAVATTNPASPAGLVWAGGPNTVLNVGVSSPGVNAALVWAAETAQVNIQQVNPALNAGFIWAGGAPAVVNIGTTGVSSPAIPAALAWASGAPATLNVGVVNSSVNAALAWTGETAQLNVGISNSAAPAAAITWAAQVAQLNVGVSNPAINAAIVWASGAPATLKVGVASNAVNAALAYAGQVAQVNIQQVNPAIPAALVWASGAPATAVANGTGGVSSNAVAAGMVWASGAPAQLIVPQINQAKNAAVAWAGAQAALQVQQINLATNAGIAWVGGPAATVVITVRANAVNAALTWCGGPPAAVNIGLFFSVSISAIPAGLIWAGSVAQVIPHPAIENQLVLKVVVDPQSSRGLLAGVDAQSGLSASVDAQSRNWGAVVDPQSGLSVTVDKQSELSVLVDEQLGRSP